MAWPTAWPVAASYSSPVIRSNGAWGRVPSTMTVVPFNLGRYRSRARARSRWA